MFMWKQPAHARRDFLLHKDTNLRGSKFRREAENERLTVHVPRLHSLLRMEKGIQ
jgi:hypothetical protein